MGDMVAEEIQLLASHDNGLLTTRIGGDRDLIPFSRFKKGTNPMTSP